MPLHVRAWGSHCDKFMAEVRLELLDSRTLDGALTLLEFAPTVLDGARSPG